MTTLLPRLDDGLAVVRGDVSAWTRSLSQVGAGPTTTPRFLPESRAVSNWREEAGEGLRPASLALVVRYASTEPAFVARCVKLNNYWCIKSARWTGEIGADAEGHTGFAKAADGADAAALLLRRYYREFGRRNALSIVRRWAPAECRSAGAAPVSARRVSPALAPGGLGKTLRARFLARNTRSGMPRRALAARGGPLRVQPWSPLARMARRPKPLSPVAASTPPVPAPKTGLLVRPSELLVKPSVIVAKPSVLLVEPARVLGNPTTSPAKSASRSASARLQDRFVAESAALPAIAAGLGAIPLLDLSLPAPLCSNDETRIRNYAGRIAASVGVNLEDDLKLFGADGRPSPNLRAVMLAMSNVELGTLRAGPALVEAAIGRLDAGTLAALSTPARTP
nr:hypothetical protein [Methylobacterium sp. BTF04]